MEIDKNTYKLIERFLDGKLSEEEAEAVIERATHDLEFSKALAFQAQGMAVVKRKDQKKLVEGLNLQFEFEKENVKPIRPWYAYPLLWVTGVVLLALGIWFFWPKAAPTHQELFAVNYKMPKTSFDRDQLDASGKRWAQVMGDYSAGNWTAASQELAVLAADPDFDYPARASFYLGASLLTEGKYAEAREAWRAVPSVSRFGEEAEWNVALSYLKEENIGFFKADLEKIARKPAHAFHGKAKRLSAAFYE